MKKKTSPSYDFSLEEIKTDLLREARALRIHSGFADQIIEKVLLAVEKYQSSHPVVTKKDIDKIVHSELKKFDKDFAFIYQNRDKII